MPRPSPLSSGSNQARQRRFGTETGLPAGSEGSNVALDRRFGTQSPQPAQPDFSPSVPPPSNPNIGFVPQRNFQGDFNLQNPGMGEWSSLFATLGLMNPGQGEVAMSQQLPGIGQPGMGQQWAEQWMPAIMSMAGSGNPMQAALSQFQQNRPDLMSDPGLSPYYENAQRRAIEGINQASAAAGGYGSSAAMDQRGEAITNLQAAQALDEADYQLAQSAENRGWEQLGADLAQGLSQQQGMWADLGRGAAFGAEEADLARDIASSQLGNLLDSTTRARLGLMTEAGLGGQAAREGRIGNAFNNMLAIPSMSFGPTLGFMGDTFDADAAMFDQEGNLALGDPAAFLSQIMRQGALKEENLGNIFELIKMWMGAGGGLNNVLSGGSGAQNTLVSNPTDWFG